MRVTQVLLALLSLASCLGAQENKSSRPSPPGTAELTVSGRNVSVTYSRPKIRDPKSGEQRKIFGGLVPYGKIWRTGANEATTIKTEGDLNIGDIPVSAGTYTLFTIPEPDKWTLIISKKTGEAGDRYPGEKEDLARVPMNVEKLTDVVDQFTITLIPPTPGNLMTMGVGAPTPARLCFAWENTKACVNLTSK